MLSRVREWLTLVLIALLPLHALFVTVATMLIAGPGHAPVSTLALWKEGLLGMIVVCAMLERGTRCWKNGRQGALHADAIDVCILLGILYAIALEIFQNSALSTLQSPFALGFKYDFLPLLGFLILRRVAWSAWFKESMMSVLLVVGAMIALYGIASFFLPMSFFTALGYSDLHSLYQAQGPLAAFQQIGGSTLRRIQSTMSGPNQLGVWLLVPLGAVWAPLLLQSVATQPLSIRRYLTAVCALLFRKKREIPPHRFLTIVYGTLLLTALLLTFSRAAWIGAAAMIAVAVWQQTKRKRLFVSAFACVLLTVAIGSAVAPQILIRRESFLGHIEKPRVALQTIIAHPLGLGLGTAGPASNRTSDTCVQQEAGSDVSWARDRTNLCLFVDGVQVQPVDRPCSCPLLTENWYLQWGVEMGIVGFFLSILIPLFVVQNAIAASCARTHLVRCSMFLTFFAVSVAALFLHAWEDTATAFTVWILLASVLHIPCEHSRTCNAQLRQS